MHKELAQTSIAPCKENINNHTLSSNILLSHLPMPMLKPSISKSLVPSNHVKIALWVKPSNEQKEKGCFSKILGERLFLDRSSPSTPTFVGKWQWLLVIDDSGDFIWSFLLKEKSNIANIMRGLIKN